VEISFDAKAPVADLEGSYSFLNELQKVLQGNRSPMCQSIGTIDRISSIGKEYDPGPSGVYIGERPFVSDFSNGYSDQEGYFLLNTKFTYKWKSLKAYVDINNLTNEEYSENGVEGGFPLEKAYYPSPKRNFLIGMSLEF
jgi:outer membrane receptor protein involved in Fe transport